MALPDQHEAAAGQAGLRDVGMAGEEAVGTGAGEVDAHRPTVVVETPDLGFVAIVWSWQGASFGIRGHHVARSLKLSVLLQNPHACAVLRARCVLAHRGPGCTRPESVL